ncbi:zf-HC2 domain-containing protein [uncultured Eubacterium sp.]|uniref:zf-HC2 domain-containing protein n=1 Tax=uncultured Eubacterium sp. TaxID=165185 RepID=UPI0025D07FA0|nr:zf-HC2 domain-containing protein [uncultured Eubacterium sp.]
MSEKNNMNQISCDMVQDLLPLYQDGLLRDSTKDAVRQHLEQCSACRHVYEQLKMPVALEKNETEQGVERFQAMVKKNRKAVESKIAVGCVISAVSAIVFFFVVFCVPVIPTNESNMRVKDVYCVKEDGIQKVYVNCQWPDSRRSAIYRPSFVLNEDGSATMKTAKEYKLTIADKVSGRAETYDNELYGSAYVELDTPCKSIIYDGKQIWSEEDYSRETPEFVYDWKEVQD